MARRIPEKDLQAIIDVVTDHRDGLSAKQLHEELGGAMALRTLQYRLKHLVENGRLVREGKARQGLPGTASPQGRKHRGLSKRPASSWFQ